MLTVVPLQLQYMHMQWRVLMAEPLDYTVSPKTDRRLISATGGVNVTSFYQHVRFFFKQSWKILERCGVSWFCLWAMKMPQTPDLSPKSWALASQREKESLTVTHFQKSGWCLRVLSFTNTSHPSVCMTSQAFSLSPSVSHTDSLCQNVIPDENILFAALSQFLPVTTQNFILAFKICCMPLPHLASLASTEYI